MASARLGAAIAVVLAAAIGAASRGAPAPGSQAVGFEHNLHERDMVVRGGEALACARCHAMRGGTLVGKPDHASCFGACHGPPPHRGDKPGDRLAVCTSCHAEAVLAAGGARGTPVHYPPYTLEPNFAITVGHRRHRAVACATCHTPGSAGGKRPPHQRCAGCHDGSAATGRGPAMTACTGCHTPATGKPMPPIIVHAEVNVTRAFSHGRHAARGGDGARCTSCHRALLDTDDNRLPAPSAATCAAARCHDGTAAFPVTAACVRCHVDPNDPEFKVARPTDRYSHATHGAVQLPCGACHPVGKSGEVRVAGHAPCVTCHADEFGQRQPRICGACHNGTEPWRALVADRSPPDDTEFGATLDHDKHPGDCARCHALTTPAEQLRPPRGHRACTGKGCHAATGGPAPALTACERCHRLGLARERRATRLAAAWSVRRAFDHAGHARGADGQPLACAACHVELHGPDVAALATPAKPTCAPCHDGTTAFKLTGTTCTRCHRGAP
jgi:c(7)-type cytochrome triheme protein